MIIIDGYNLLYKWSNIVNAKNSDFEDIRNMLIEKILAGVDEDEIIIVFDSRQHKKTEITQVTNNLKIVFTGKIGRADFFITKTSENLKNHKNITVVTGDRIIKDFCFNNGAQTINSDTFIEQINNKIQKIKSVPNPPKNDISNKKNLNLNTDKYNLTNYLSEQEMDMLNQIRFNNDD